jgi:fructose-bisphosphate aldolase class II
MTVVSFHTLMGHAADGQYAVGYFECWNLESLMAVVDAAEATRSPVLAGFSGIYLPDPARLRSEPPGVYAAMGLEACRRASVPAGLVFNESPYLKRVLQAVDDGYGLVMFSDEDLSLEDQTAITRQVAEAAHAAGCAVEGEAMPLPGVGGDLQHLPAGVSLTDVDAARDFVARTEVDAFAVNIGQIHLHGRRKVQLDLERLSELDGALDVPLVLHGASSVHPDDIREAIRRGIRKINVGSVLKQTYFEAMRAAAVRVPDLYNPYEVIGSGLDKDVLMAGRVPLQETVEGLMQLFGSAGKADVPR